MLFFFEIPVGVRKRFDFYRSFFFWKTDDTKKNIGLQSGTWFVDPKIKED
jgi:hypothetical protein